VEVQSRAVRRWRESGGSISFQQALQEVMRGKEVEEEPIKSRAEGGEGAVEEVEVEKPSEAALQQILSKVEEKPKEERIRECAEYFKRYLRGLGIPEPEAAKIAEHEDVKRLYEEVGASPLDFGTLLYLTGWKKIMFDVFKLGERAPSRAGDLSRYIPRLVEELRRGLDAVKRKMERSEPGGSRSSAGSGCCWTRSPKYYQTARCSYTQTCR